MKEVFVFGFVLAVHAALYLFCFYAVVLFFYQWWSLHLCYGELLSLL